MPLTASELNEALPIGVVEIDATGAVVYANSAAEAVAGEIVAAGGRPLSAIHPDDLATLVEHVGSIGVGEPFAARYRFTRSDGELRWGETKGRTRVDETGALLGVVASVEDVTDAMADRVRRQRFTELLDATADVVALLDIDGTISWANQTARTYMGDCDDGSSVHLRDLLTDTAVRAFDDAVLPALLDAGFWSGELELSVSGEYAIPVSVSAIAHRDDDGELRFLSITCRDISELKAIQSRLEAQATHDGLTGLPNRVLFMEHLSSAIHRVGRNCPPLAVMFCDLDGFKAVNDGLGHEAGDQLLIEVAKRFQANLRDGDVVARFGGDEFCVLLPGVESIDLAQTVADRLMKAIEAPIALEGGEGNVGTSIGIAICEDPGRDPEDLLGDADTAMYRAKKNGKRCRQLFDDELRDEAARKSELVREMPSAVERDEFHMHYRPVRALADGSIVGIEAGLRWDHPQRGALSAADWVPLAYDAGVILPLDRRAIEHAITLAPQWNAGRPEDHPIAVWVTVGAQDLLRGGLAQLVTELIEDSAVGPGTFGLEVGLSAIAKHPREAESVLKSLSWLGVRIALDDFGISNFTISQLQAFRVECIKLDSNVIHLMARDGDSITAVAAIVQLAQALGLTVQAKGIRNVAQLELLQDLGVHHGQGDIVGGAVDGDAIDALLAVPEIGWMHGPWPQRRTAEGTRLTRSQVMERMIMLNQASRAERPRG